MTDRVDVGQWAVLTANLVPDGLFVVDTDGQLLACGEHVYRTRGQSPEVASSGIQKLSFAKPDGSNFTLAELPFGQAMLEQAAVHEAELTIRNLTTGAVSDRPAPGCSCHAGSVPAMPSCWRPLAPGMAGVLRSGRCVWVRLPAAFWACSPGD